MKRVQSLASITVPDKFYRRLMTGNAVFDQLVGGQESPGIVPSEAIFLSGGAGLGKSTLAMQMADMYSINTGRQILYNSSEESVEMIKMRASRVGIKSDLNVSDFDQISDLTSHCRGSGVEVLIVDSLNEMLEGTDKSDNAVVRTANKLIDLAHEEDICVIVLGHVTKSGVFAGRNTLQHIFDAHMHLFFDEKMGVRIIQMEKNRFGPSLIPFEMKMTALGVELTAASVEGSGGEQGAPGGRVRERREQITEKIRSLFLEGNAISGYCFSRFGVDCSGGYWRGMTEKVRMSMEREGFKFDETKINMRSFVRATRDPLGHEIVPIEKREKEVAE